MNPFCFLLWISVVGCNPVAHNYRDAAIATPAAHLQVIEISHDDHASVTPALGRLSLPARNDEQLLYHFTHAVAHLAFYANGQDLQFRWAAWFWWGNVPRGHLSGYSARVLAGGDWWQAAKEDAADSYAALFTGAELDPERRTWLCTYVDGLASKCPSAGHHRNWGTLQWIQNSRSF